MSINKIVVSGRTEIKALYNALDEILTRHLVNNVSMLTLNLETLTERLRENGADRITITTGHFWGPIKTILHKEIEYHLSRGEAIKLRAALEKKISERKWGTLTFSTQGLSLMPIV